MTRGRGLASKGCIGKSSGRGNFATCGNMPSVPIPSSSPQLGGASSLGGPIHASVPSSTPPVIPIQASGHGSTLPIHLEPSPVIPNQRNIVDEGISSCSNIVGDQVERSSTKLRRTLGTTSPTGLESSGPCSGCITRSFKKELDPRGINWKSVSEEMKEFYFGEFKKAFYWDDSIDTIVREQWDCKAAIRYSDLVSKIKTNKMKLDNISEDVLSSWKTLWADPVC